MKDFPLFDTEYGVASLILKEVPYKGIAYVHIRSVQEGHFADLLAECRSFCRMVGAEHIYAAGHEALEDYPLYTAVWEYRRDGEAPAGASLFPVTEATAGQWRRIYNEKMRPVPNAATLEQKDETRLRDRPGAYFIHQNGELLGIGWLEDTKLLALAAVKPGAGETVLSTLLELTQGELVLEAASENARAIRLYEKLGFVRTRELSRWHEIG